MHSSDKNDMFATTRWSVVLQAGQADSSHSRTALTALCQTYWYPLYAYIRHRGHNPHDAEDLTQGFFAKLLRLNSLAGLSPEKGKFRAFLLASLKNHLAEEWHRSSAQKRDARITISLDAQEAETRYAMEPAVALTPEHLFERRWALTLLETVLNSLAEKYEATGRSTLFEELRFSITGEKSEAPLRELAIRLGMSDEAIRVAIFRLRKNYRKALRDEIANTVTTRSEVAEELGALRRILST